MFKKIIDFLKNLFGLTKPHAEAEQNVNTEKGMNQIPDLEKSTKVEDEFIIPPSPNPESSGKAAV